MSPRFLAIVEAFGDHGDQPFWQVVADLPLFLIGHRLIPPLSSSYQALPADVGFHLAFALHQTAFSNANKAFEGMMLRPYDDQPAAWRCNSVAHWHISLCSIGVLLPHRYAEYETVPI